PSAGLELHMVAHHRPHAHSRHCRVPDRCAARSEAALETGTTPTATTAPRIRTTGDSRMFSLPWVELSRFKRHAITRLAMIVIADLPAIYGGPYLASKWTRTDNHAKLQAAEVTEDSAAEKPDSDGETLHSGDELVDEITPEGEGGFDWEETSQEEADEGLAEGKYFAVLEIPSNFSERLVSTGGDDPEQA